jgi:hypothetical protein
MNQTIALGSLTDNVLFDKILFGYTDQYLSPFTGGDAVPVGAIEIVDNVLINFVPLPGAIVFMLSGVLALGVSCKVKRKSSC